MNEKWDVTAGWTCADWKHHCEQAAICDQADEHRSAALALAADDIGSGKNEAGVPERFRSRVAEYLLSAAKC
jgi:hypothetical protein